MSMVKSGDVDIHYHSVGPISGGAGSATLWVHGAGGNAGIWWQQANHFAGNHKFIAYDHRSFGRSHCSMDLVLPEKLAGDAQAVLDAEGVKSAAVICQSLGGWTGIRLALAAPERVEKLVLSGTMAGINHAPAIEAALNSGEKMDDRGPSSIAVGPVMTAENPFKAYLYEQAGAFNTSFDHAKLGSFFAPDALVDIADLARIKCPVLLISGDSDAIWPAECLTALVDAFPNARQEIIADSGHSPYFERPVEFNASVAKFLSE